MNAVQPRSVTFLSWLFILSGVLGVGCLLWLQLEPAILNESPFELTTSVIALSWWSSLVYLVSGVFLLYGRNIGRHLLWIGLTPALIAALLTTKRWDASLFSFGLLLITIWPLFTPSARRYFTRQQTERDLFDLSQHGSTELSVWRKVLGILLFVVSGFLIYLVSFLAFLNVYGQYEILLEALYVYAVPWVFVHGMALFIYHAPSRYFVSGITFLSGVGFTLFIIIVIFNYPLPEIEVGIDVKESFGGIKLGASVAALLAAAGVVQLAVHFFAVNQTREQRS